MKQPPRPIPFALNRNLRIPLATQLAENLRNAILTGYYKEREILPSYKQLANGLNVSLRIPREAMSDLVARDMVNPRPRIGCEVLPRKAKAWKGRIHVVAPGDTFITYFVATLFEKFRRNMTERGWLVDLITFSRTETGKSDFAMLDEALTRSCDFVVLIYPTVAALRRVEISHTRYICLGCDACSQVNGIAISFTSALEEIIRLIRRNGIKNVALIEYKQLTEIHRAFSEAGIAFKPMEVPWMTGVGYLERISRKGYELTRRLLAAHRKRLPELIVFTDDFVARGGLSAILETGMKIPDDLKVITFSNKGNTPFFPVKLTRIEADPFDLANLITDEILKRMSGLPPQGVKHRIRFLPGASL